MRQTGGGGFRREQDRWGATSLTIPAYRSEGFRSDLSSMKILTVPAAKRGAGDGTRTGGAFGTVCKFHL